MSYYYTPITVNVENGHYEVAKENDESAMAELLGGIKALKLDRDVGRYVLKCPADQPQLGGWVERTAQEVVNDYPDLAGEV